MIKGLVFLVFVGLSLAVARRRPGATLPRSTLTCFLAFSVAVSVLTGVTGREAWPFSHWPMDNTLIPSDFRYLAPVAVDSSQREFPVDPRAFEPLSWVDVTTWLIRFGPLDARAETQVGQFLLDTIRQARDRAAAGADVGTYRRRLGPLAAPNTQLSPERWESGARDLPGDIAHLRVYEYRAKLDGPVRPWAEQSKRLVFEFPKSRQ